MVRGPRNNSIMKLGAWEYHENGNVKPGGFTKRREELSLILTTHVASIESMT
jgi:hypothetical protein